MPYVVSRKYGVTSVTRPPLTPTLGPWHRPSAAKSANRLRAEKDNIEDLLRQLPHYHRCSILCHPELVNVLPFHWAGFKLSVKYTYRFPNLRDSEAIWSGFSENIRREIRKAHKRVGIECDLGASQFFDVYSKTFQRQGCKPPISPALLKRVDEALANRGNRRQWFAVDDRGRTHAAIYVVWDQRCAYYLMGGGDPELRNSGAHSLLIWHAIQQCAKVTEAFDFQGSMLEPVERFFRSFGTMQTPYYQATRVNGRMLRLAARVLGAVG
jgi:hypothetical protein